MIAATLGAVGFAHAAVVSSSNVATATAKHTDSILGLVFSTTQTAANLSAIFPSQTTTVASHSYTTEGYFTSQVTTNTPTLLLVDGYFVSASQFGGSFSGVPLVTAAAEISASNTLTFTLDAPGTVTLKNFNVGTTIFPGNSPTFFEAALVLDGVTYHTSASDGTYTVPVAAGIHTASYELRAAAFRLGSSDGSYNANGLMQSYHQIVVSSVPEPATTVTLLFGASLLLGIRRSRS